MTEPAGLADAQDTLAARVQAAFERVLRERMTGLPFVNPALRVELVGLRRWRGMWLGVLVTPWFMNLLLLPGDGAADAEAPAAVWPRVRTGEYAQFAFPAGVLSFLAGCEGEAGEYLTCSLFSPMFEFAEHEVARQTAEACLVALFEPSPAAAAAPAEPVHQGKRDFLRGPWHEAAAASDVERR